MRRLLTAWLALWRRLIHGAETRPTGGDAAPADGRAAGAHQAHAAHAAPMGGPMLDCEQVMRQLWDYLDDELTLERMAAIRGHLELCKRCYPQYEFERSFLDAVATRGRQHSDPERLRSRLATALRAQGLDDG